jgi:hypothetical protein
MAEELTGSRKALFELFSLPQGLPHGAKLGLVGKARKEARQRRLHRWSWEMRQKAAKRRLERYGLDELGPDRKPVPAVVRIMRNARKQERA